MSAKRPLFEFSQNEKFWFDYVMHNQIGGICCKKMQFLLFSLLSVLFLYMYFMVSQFLVQFLIFSMSNIDLILQFPPKLLQERRSELFNSI
jgi:uncharacterized membrane protein YcaP (DUF421 family)